MELNYWDKPPTKLVFKVKHALILIVLIAVVAFSSAKVLDYFKNTISDLRDEISHIEQQNVALLDSIKLRDVIIDENKGQVRNLQKQVDDLTTRQTGLKSSLVKITRQYESDIQIYSSDSLSGRIQRFRDLLPNE